MISVVYSKGSLLCFPNGIGIVERINITKGWSPLSFQAALCSLSSLMNGALERWNTKLTMKSEVGYYFSCLQQLLCCCQSRGVVCWVPPLTFHTHAGIKSKDVPITVSASASYFANAYKWMAPPPPRQGREHRQHFKSHELWSRHSWNAEGPNRKLLTRLS